MVNKKNLRISIIGRTYPWRGGISHYNSELCNHLANHATIQILSYKMSFQRLHPWKNEIDYKSENFLKGHPKFVFDLLNPLTWKKTADEIIKFKPNLVIFQWTDPYYAVQFASIINSIRSRVDCKILAICHEPLARLKTRFFSMPLIKWVFRKFDLLIVHSDQDYQNVKKLIPTANVRKLFHPIYDMFYKKIGEFAARKKLNLSGNILLFFGYVRKDKGLSVLLDALPKVLKNIQVTLLIVGEFYDRKEEYVKQIKKLNIEKNILLVDRYVSNQEVPFYFSAADAVVLPYLSATQSGVANIAYAFNKPIIASNVGGLAEIITNDKNGYLVKPGDANELATKIVNFFVENKKKKFESGMMRVKKNYSWNVFCKRLLSK